MLCSDLHALEGFSAYLIRRILYSISTQNFAKIFCAAHYVLWPAEPNAVVIIWKLSLRGSKLINLESDLVPLHQAGLTSQNLDMGSLEVEGRVLSKPLYAKTMSKKHA